jgi:hypothetical protein
VNNTHSVQPEPEPTTREVIEIRKPENLLARYCCILILFLWLAICLGIARSGYIDLTSVDYSQQDPDQTMLQEDLDRNSSQETPEPMIKFSVTEDSLALGVLEAIAIGCITTVLLILVSLYQHSQINRQN